MQTSYSFRMLRPNVYPYLCNLCLTTVDANDGFHGIGECVEMCDCTWTPEDKRSWCAKCSNTMSPELIILKSITLWQPWANALVRGIKRLETRPNQWHHRGPIAVHAAAKPFRPQDYEPSFVAFLNKLGLLDDRLSGLVGVVNVVDCKPVSSLKSLGEVEAKLGNYAPGRWYTECTTIREFPLTIPCAGKQGFFYTEVNRKAITAR